MGIEFVERYIEETLIKAHNRYETRFAWSKSSLKEIIDELYTNIAEIKSYGLDLSNNKNYKKLCKIVKEFKIFYDTPLNTAINNSTFINV